MGTDSEYIQHYQRHSRKIIATMIGVKDMTFILFGCLAFVFFYIFDLNKVRFLNKNINFCFIVGILFLAAATVGILLHQYQHFELSMPLKMLFSLLAIGSLLLLFYTLFFALPYGETYLDAERQKAVICKGMYAFCRHPGVIWLFLLYLFLWLASGKMMMLSAGIVWTAMDLGFVYIEDRCFFPKILNGYDRYQMEVPFLIPNRDSIKKYIASC